jgi:hypothetical protein
MGFDNTLQDADLARMAKTTDGALLAVNQNQTRR